MLLEPGEMMTKQVLQDVGISRPTLYKLEKRGLIPARRNYNNYRIFARKDVDRLKEILRERRK